MKPVGFLRASFEIAAKDLRVEWRTLETLSSSLIFSLIVMVIFNFAFGFETIRKVGVDRLVPGVIWIMLAFAAVVGMVRSMQLERQGDTLNALFLAPIDHGAIYIGKFLANLAKIVILQVILLPVSAVLFDYNLFAIAAPLFLVVFVHSLALTELGTLFAAVSTRLGRGEALLSTLLFPAVSPIFISAVKCTASLLQGDGLAPVSHWMMIAIGFDVMYLLVALMTFEFVLEE